MKKLILGIVVGSMICLCGCSNNPVKNKQAELYNDDEAIVQSYDSYSYHFRSGKGEDSEVKMDFKEFSGTDTIMTISCDEEEALTLTYNTKIKDGELKLVFINPDNKIETIVEGEGSGDYITTLESGNYRVKSVGKYAEGSLEIKADTNAKVIISE